MPLEDSFRRWRRNVLVGYIVILLGAMYTFALVQEQHKHITLLQKRSDAALALKLCRNSNKGRVEGNRRALLLKEVVDEVIESQRIAIANVPDYKPPKQLAKLEALPSPKPLPTVPCT